MTRARDLSRAVNNKMTVFKYTATAGQTTFTGADGGGATLAYDPNSTIVTYNGIILESTSEYTATNGTSVVLTAGAEVGAEVNILAFEDVAYSGVMPTTGGTFSGAVTVDGAFTSKGIDDNATTTAITIGSDEKVGIGTSSIDRELHVKKTDTGGTVAKFENSAGSTFVELTSSAGGGANSGYIEYNATKDFKFAPGDTNRMTIKADGKVGIGLEAPTAPLHIESPDNSDFMHITVTGNEKWALRGESGSGSNDFIGLGIAGGVQAMYWNENGAVRKPSNPCASWGSTTDLAMQSAGWTILALNHINFNIGNCYSNSTYRFTAPVSGIYMVGFSGEFNIPSTTTWTYLAPRINGSATANISNKGNVFSDFNTPAHAYHQHAQTWFLNLAEGDWFHFASVGSGGSINAKAKDELAFFATLLQ